MAKTEGTFRKFIRNPLGLIGLCFIVLVFLAGLLAVPLSPDQSPNANEMFLSISGKHPMFSVKVLSIPKSDAEQQEQKAFGFLTGYTEQEKHVLIQDWQWTDEGIWIEEYLDEGLEGPKRVIPIDAFGALENEQDFEKRFVERKTFLLGTDRFGRDMLSRMLWGARVSLAVGAIAVFISLLIGITLGALAGYFGGWVDKSIMWLINVVWSLPTLLLVIALSLALGKGFWQIFIAVGLSMWVEVARMVRGQVLSIKQKDYIESAKVLGLGNMRILFRHILPNITGPITVIAAANFAASILLEAGLSFLGLGVQPPVPSWGQMIKEHYGYIILDSAYLAIIPGLAIMLLVMSFNFVGNALRDTLDVRIK